MTMENKPMLLLVEDDMQILHFMVARLESQGYHVVTATTGREALAKLSAHPFDLCLLDLGLPDMDGMDVISHLPQPHPPVIVVSARDQETDKVRALDAGAEDYLTKPFGVGELMARVRVFLRRAAAANEGVLAVGRLSLDIEARQVTLDGHLLHLTPNEYKLLTLLMSRAGKVITHKAIMTHVWGPGANSTELLRVLMAGLRRKIEADTSKPRYLFTEAGVGYRFAAE